MVGGEGKKVREERETGEGGRLKKKGRERKCWRGDI